MKRLALASGLAVVLAVAPSFADDADAGAADASDAGPAPTCVERLPKNVARPTVTEHFPTQGKAGYAAPLELVIAHGKGETVMPEGLRLKREGEQEKLVTAAEFAIPELDAGSGATLEVQVKGDVATTRLVLPFVPLPKHAGRNTLTLPPLPITIARANGDAMVVCTNLHTIRVEEPISNELDPSVRPNAPPRPQREEWVFMEQLAVGLGIGLAAGVALALLVRWWMRRPKRVFVPPKRAPWLVALEELDELRRSALLSEQKNDVYFDRVSDCVRKYLGARYGFEQLGNFEGLETTTDEMRALLTRVRPAIVPLLAIGEFLDECDLVKFARVFPPEDDCREAVRRAEHIVRQTTPIQAPQEATA